MRWAAPWAPGISSLAHVPCVAPAWLRCEPVVRRQQQRRLRRVNVDAIVEVPHPQHDVKGLRGGRGGRQAKRGGQPSIDVGKLRVASLEPTGVRRQVCAHEQQRRAPQIQRDRETALVGHAAARPARRHAAPPDLAHVWQQPPSHDDGQVAAAHRGRAQQRVLGLRRRAAAAARLVVLVRAGGPDGLRAISCLFLAAPPAAVQSEVRFERRLPDRLAGQQHGGGNGPLGLLGRDRVDVVLAECYPRREARCRRPRRVHVPGAAPDLHDAVWLGFAERRQIRCAARFEQALSLTRGWLRH